MVDRLERSGLVCRRACPTDRRISYAAITEAGSDRLAQVLPGHIAMIEQWFTGLLDPEQLASLVQMLRTIRDAVRPDAVAGATAATP